MQTANKKPRFETVNRRESRERKERWRLMAATLAKRHPTWGAIEIAREIQRSEAGRKRGSVLTYSIDHIVRNIRGAG